MTTNQLRKRYTKETGRSCIDGLTGMAFSAYTVWCEKLITSEEKRMELVFNRSRDRTGAAAGTEDFYRYPTYESYKNRKATK